MYNLFVVYYINCIVNNNYLDWLKNQIKYITDLNAKIYIHATISEDLDNTFKQIVIQLFPNENIIIQCNYTNEYEYPGILKVWQIGQEHCNKNDIILYFHSKGVTHNPNYTFNINDCCNIILKDFNKIKNIFTTYDKIDKIGYSCGGNGWIWYNFWYARGSYIKMVEKPIKTTRRHYYEDWLGRHVETNNDIICDIERPFSYYKNTLMSCYSFYVDSIHGNIGSYFDPNINNMIQIYNKNMYLFDWNYYLYKYPDLKNKGITTKDKAIEHWMNNGINENRNSRMYLFDVEYYLNKYPDLRINNVNTEEEAIQHWLNNGSKEGRNSNIHEIDYIEYNR